MDHNEDLEATARTIIESNLYMVLGTADESGHPWVSPVYYAAEGYTEFYWVSSPDARHSRNLAARPNIRIVVFDSQVPIDTGQGVYMAAVAEELTGAEVDRGIGIFARSSLARGGSEWKREDVVAPSPYRLYRATATEHSVLDPDAHPVRRIEVTV
jgi:nitroimidazol reductase NimA-like FMN-containing flavoprotein (pyridoxamine 5'-phosphate oxidase superfamily)